MASRRYRHVVRSREHDVERAGVRVLLEPVCRGSGMQDRVIDLCLRHADADRRRANRIARSRRSRAPPGLPGHWRFFAPPSVASPPAAGLPARPVAARARRPRAPPFRDPRAEAGRPLPAFVQQEFDGYLKCGRLDEGFLLARDHELPVRRQEKPAKAFESRPSATTFSIALP